MEDPVNIQDDSQRTSLGWKEQAAALYKSLVVFSVACYFFVLRILQEFFKSGGDAAACQYDDAKPISVNNTIQLRSAGEIPTIHSSAEKSTHTVVDLQSSPAATVHADVGATPQQPVILQEPPKVTEPTSEQSKNTLVMKNLPFKFKLNDLEKLLGECQAKAKNVRLLRDDSGKSTGMAFVRCASKEETQRLISALHDREIAGRKLQVEFKTKKQKNKKRLSASSDSMSSSSSECDRIEIPRLELPPRIPIKQSPAKLVEEQKPLRRKSTSDYVHSAIMRIHADKSTIRPIRQPIGPDGNTNGFSAEYRRTRTVKP